MKSNTLWALITGLAVGFIVGREFTRGGSASTGDSKTGSSATTTAAADTGATGTIPADWVKEGEMNATDQFAGLTAAQRYVALKVLNEKPCDCGCPHGSVAKCKKEDPGCPRAPTIISTTVSLAKQGKSVEEILAAVKKPAGDSAPAAAGPQKVELAAWTPIKGPKNAKVTIVEFSDFQCPFCGRVVPTVKEIEEKYGKDVRIAFRHQPLPFHNHAMEAAEAAMAANAQGKFWPMHDKLFANQQKLERADLDKYAEEVGLNMSRYKAAMDQHQYKNQIESDSKAGTGWGASGTPAFFINGQSLSGAQPFDSFKAVIDKEIQHADTLLKGGVSADKLYEKILETMPKDAPAAAAAAPPTHVDVAVEDAPVKGPKNAPVTILEFSDFQCPFCSRVLPTIKQLESDYAGKLRIAFKMSPLPFHAKAPLAAEAALAANEQGKFWEMHDKLFANQANLERTDLERYAQELGLDMGKFKSALDSGKFKAHVEKDKAEAAKAGATGTPTFAINGTLVIGAQPVDAFKKVIDEALAKKK
jgi:protein-disulfide isomerase